jgi:hypothetical protein
MFDHEFVKVLQAGLWVFQHAYLLIVAFAAVLFVALTEGGDK